MLYVKFEHKSKWSQFYLEQSISLVSLETSISFKIIGTLKNCTKLSQIKMVNDCQKQGQDTGGLLEGRCFRHRCRPMKKQQIKLEDTLWLDCPPGESIEVTNFALKQCNNHRYFHNKSKVRNVFQFFCEKITKN